MTGDTIRFFTDTAHAHSAGHGGLAERRLQELSEQCRGPVQCTWTFFSTRIQSEPPPFSGDEFVAIESTTVKHNELEGTVRKGPSYRKKTTL